MTYLIDKHGDQVDCSAESVRIYVRDPNDGSRILRNNSRDMLFEWCRENCSGGYWIGMGFGQFELGNDAVLFKMRWG